MKHKRSYSTSHNRKNKHIDTDSGFAFHDNNSKLVQDINKKTQLINQSSSTDRNKRSDNSGIIYIPSRLSPRNIFGGKKKKQTPTDNPTVSVESAFVPGVRDTASTPSTSYSTSNIRTSHNSGINIQGSSNLPHMDINITQSTQNTAKYAGRLIEDNKIKSNTKTYQSHSYDYILRKSTSPAPQFSAGNPREIKSEADLLQSSSHMYEEIRDNFYENTNNLQGTTQLSTMEASASFTQTKSSLSTSDSSKKNPAAQTPQLGSILVLPQHSSANYSPFPTQPNSNTSGPIYMDYDISHSEIQYNAPIQGVISTQQQNKKTPMEEPRQHNSMEFSPFSTKPDSISQELPMTSTRNISLGKSKKKKGTHIELQNCNPTNNPPISVKPNCVQESALNTASTPSTSNSASNTKGFRNESNILLQDVSYTSKVGKINPQTPQLTPTQNTPSSVGSGCVTEAHSINNVSTVKSYHRAYTSNLCRGAFSNPHKMYMPSTSFSRPINCAPHSIESRIWRAHSTNTFIDIKANFKAFNSIQSIMQGPQGSSSQHYIIDIPETETVISCKGKYYLCKKGKGETLKNGEILPNHDYIRIPIQSPPGKEDSKKMLEAVDQAHRAYSEIINDLESKKENLEQVNKKLRSRKGINKHLSKENRKLQRKLVGSKINCAQNEKSASAYYKGIVSNARENSELTKQNSELEKNIKQLEKQLLELKEQNSELQKQNSMSNSALPTLPSVNTQRDTIVDKSSGHTYMWYNDNSKYYEQINENGSESNASLNEVPLLKKENSELKKNIEELLQANSYQIKALEEKNSELERTNNQNLSLIEQLKELKKRSDYLEEQNSLLSNRTKWLEEKQLKEGDSYLLNQIKELEEKNSELERTNNQNLSLIEQLKAKLRDLTMLSAREKENSHQTQELLKDFLTTLKEINIILEKFTKDDFAINYLEELKKFIEPLYSCINCYGLLPQSNNQTLILIPGLYKQINKFLDLYTATHAKLIKYIDIKKSLHNIIVLQNKTIKIKRETVEIKRETVENHDLKNEIEELRIAKEFLQGTIRLKSESDAQERTNETLNLVFDQYYSTKLDDALKTCKFIDNILTTYEKIQKSEIEQSKIHDLISYSLLLDNSVFNFNEQFLSTLDLKTFKLVMKLELNKQFLNLKRQMKFLGLRDKISDLYEKLLNEINNNLYKKDDRKQDILWVKPLIELLDKINKEINRCESLNLYPDNIQEYEIDNLCTRLKDDLCKYAPTQDIKILSNASSRKDLSSQYYYLGALCRSFIQNIKKDIDESFEIEKEKKKIISEIRNIHSESELPIPTVFPQPITQHASSSKIDHTGTSPATPSCSLSFLSSNSMHAPGDIRIPECHSNEASFSLNSHHYPYSNLSGPIASTPLERSRATPSQNSKKSPTQTYRDDSTSCPPNPFDFNIGYGESNKPIYSINNRNTSQHSSTRGSEQHSEVTTPSPMIITQGEELPKKLPGNNYSAALRDSNNGNPKTLVTGDTAVTLQGCQQITVLNSK